MCRAEDCPGMREARGAPASWRPAIMDRMAGRRERLTGEVIAAGQSEPGLCIMAECLKYGLGAAVLLVRQYRPAVAKVVYDFPGGYLEVTDGSPAERARAELREETGYACTELLSTGQIHVAPHRSDKTDYTFLALGCEKAGAARLDETEDITFSIVPMPALRGLINTA